ncbi:hypothetical protein [Flavobacterium cellulosilyticum]|uniref:Uncharacterized protein n=1 Tax=Flavobacterium cellulosilyticum TaxID=2541731 RepID=A0A4R5CF16_9FLAO|nr:hypothetical protein [Flavobacterium cellulosilyticum]TDD98661.1 hypothetical protein E0F76_05915 [Flavobacterium cellulosilyticum]
MVLAAGTKVKDLRALVESRDETTKLVLLKVTSGFYNTNEGFPFPSGMFVIANSISVDQPKLTLPLYGILIAGFP